MKYDAIVIGGSYAGMAAALQLARTRRPVLVIDAGERRNRFASHSHGFLGQDGVDPGEIAAQARRQLQAYASLTWVDGRTESVTGDADDFAVTTTDGTRYEGRRILLASGVADRLPPVPGLAERWGQSVFHCPYCHGHEVNQGRVGIVGANPLSAHQAELLSDWGQVTLLVNDALTLDAALRDTLARRGVSVEESPIETIEGHADVRLRDGRLLAFDALFTATTVRPSSDLPQRLGCTLAETPMGLHVRTDAESKTSVVGVFACGDVAQPMHSVSLAVGSGAMAGIQVHRSLMWPESLQPAQAAPTRR